jgi:hypothetical protein
VAWGGFYFKLGQLWRRAGSGRRAQHQRIDDSAGKRRTAGAPAGAAHDILIEVVLRLELPAIRYLAASCRLLQYGQSATQAFTPIEDALRLRSERRG